MGTALTHYMQIDLEIDKGTPAPTYKFETDDSISLDQNVDLSVLDRHDRNVYVISDSQQGMRHNYSGMLSVAALENNMITVQFPYNDNSGSYTAPTASQYLSCIADEINLDWGFRGTDFSPASIGTPIEDGLGKYEVYTGKLYELLDKLFGWSKDIPRKEYVYFIDNGTLRVTQRGRETNSVSLETYAVRTPTIQRVKYNSEWGSNTTGDRHIYSGDSQENNVPFTGTISWGGHTINYVDGYVDSETVATDPTDPTDTVQTEYRYTTVSGSDGMYVDKKTVTNGTTVTETTYTYQNTNNNVFLAEEDTVVKESGSVIEETLKITTPIGNGFYGFTTYDITGGGKEVISSSMGQGASGNRVTQYMVNAQNAAIKTGEDPQEEVVMASIDGVAKIRSIYPIKGETTLQAIADELDATKSMTEETLTAEIAGFDSVIDYDYTILYQGNTYYLESNHVTITPSAQRQSIVAKRWY